MEIKIHNDRVRRRKDPVVEQEGVFKNIEPAALKPTEQARIEREEVEQATLKPEPKIWSIKQIAKRLGEWLHLRKPSE